MQGWRWTSERSKLQPMKRLVLLAALALSACALSACAGGSGPREYPGVRLKPTASPSTVIAAEIGFAQLAQAKGQWTAFRETAAADAEMFTPRRVNAQGWLKGRADPPISVKWQPHEIYMSCDGSYGVTRGAWQGAQQTGYFTTVWQRQKDGSFNWVLDSGDPLATPLTAPEMIAAKVADCAKITQAQASASAAASSDRKEHGSTDGTLIYASEVFADGSRQFTLKLWDGKEFDTVIETSTAPQDH